jgi:predicted O-methyltransferase YrrM
MRSIEHWSLLYAVDRLAEIAYQRGRPHEPWLTKQANLALTSLLKPTDVGLEFGSGRSTVWFAARLKHLTSVEHNADWHKIVDAMLDERAIANVTYRFRKPAAEESISVQCPYVSVVDEFEDRSLDFILVDGAQRGLCAMAGLSKVRPGGMLVIDNVNWFLPSASRSPNSRSFAHGPRRGPWEEVHAVLKNWRVLWTTNGVSDTAIYFRP